MVYDGSFEGLSVSSVDCAGRRLGSEASLCFPCSRGKYSGPKTSDAIPNTLNLELDEREFVSVSAGVLTL